MYHRHQSCKVQVSISGHDDECFHGNGTAHTRYYSASQSPSDIFLLLPFFSSSSVIAPFVRAFVHWFRHVCAVFFFHHSPALLLLLHYFLLFFVCAVNVSFVCMCDDGVSKVHPSVGHNDDDDDDDDRHGPRSVTRRTEQRNVLREEKKHERKISLRWHKVTSRLGFGRPLNAITAKHTRDDHVHKCDYAWYYILHVCVFWTFFSAFFLLLLFRCENRLQYYKAGTGEAIRAHARTTTT